MPERSGDEISCHVEPDSNGKLVNTRRKTDSSW